MTATYSNTLRDDNERPIAGAQVYVYDQTGKTLQALTNPVGGGALANPVITDEFGNFSFSTADDGVKLLDIFLNTHRIWKETVLAGVFVITAAAGSSVSNRALLAAIAAPVANQSAILTESGREGSFVFDSADHSAHVTADTAQGIYVAPASDPTGASGAWVRKFTGVPSAKWFGAQGDGVADDAAAINAGNAAVGALGIDAIKFDAGHTFKFLSELTFASDDMLVIAHGAKLTSPVAAFQRLVNLSGNNGQWFGGEIEFSGLAATYGENNGSWRWSGLKITRANPASIPWYVRDGVTLEAVNCRFYWYGGFNCFNPGALTFRNCWFVNPYYLTNGSDDAIAIKAYSGHIKNLHVEGCYFEGTANMVGFGSQIGNFAAADPTRAKGFSGARIINNYGKDLASLVNFKGGGIDGTAGSSFDYRDGFTRDVVVSGNVLEDLTGAQFQRAFIFGPSRGNEVSNIRGWGNIIRARAASTSQSRVTCSFYIPYYQAGATEGTAPASVQRVNVGFSYEDPYQGAANDGTHPGYPVTNVVRVEADDPAHATYGDITLSVDGNGSEANGIEIAAGFDNSIYIARAHLKNIDTNGSSSFGGIWSASIVEIGTDYDISMAAGSSGRKFIISGTGDIRTRSTLVGLEPKLTLKSKNGTGAAAKGSVSFTDDADAEYAYIGDRDGSNTAFTVSSTGSIVLDAATTTSSKTLSVTGASVAFPSVVSATLDVDSGGGRLLAYQNGSGFKPLSLQGSTITIKPNGGAPLFTATANGFGYDTGTGGTSTQPTSKSTGVTLSKVCGQITMNAAALAAGAKVSFTVTNTAVAATDVVIVNVSGGGTANAYRASVAGVVAGSFNVTVENITAGSLSEAVVLNFAIIKGVNA
jgi:hypothetical protein